MKLISGQSRRGFIASLLATAAAPAIMPALPQLLPSSIIETPAGPLMTNRTIRRYMDIQAIRNRNVLLQAESYADGVVATFRSIPIRLEE